MDLGLKGRVAIVAASSKGIGRAIAAEFAREGAIVAMCARNPEPLRKAASEIGAYSEAIDVTQEDQVSAFVRNVQARYDRVDICLANAGGPPPGTFEQTSVDDWRAAVDLNLMSTLFFARAVLPIMKARGWGRFLTLTSISVKQPIDRLILSNSVRSAVTGLVKSLSNEYASHGVLVNNICPGFTATDRLKALEDTWSSQIPAGRAGKPEEIAALAVFLASDRASYITGQSIVVDGGYIKSAL
jgi:3-oxoacyl-[acyl-carrier protein] reductase